MVSGCALVVDYVLTISISVAAGVDQIFSFLPPSWHQYQFARSSRCSACSIILNLRGVKESVQILVPIFLLFIATHFPMIVAAVVAAHSSRCPAIFAGAVQEARATVGRDRLLPTLLIILRAYSLGGGAYTGIEAVSNSVQIIREPRVPNEQYVICPGVT